MKRFLCSQMVVIDDDRNGNISMQIILRNVGAINKEEALGKFLLNTTDIIVKERLTAEVFELDLLMKIG